MPVRTISSVSFSTYSGISFLTLSYEWEMKEQYEQTLHIDHDYVVRIDRKAKTYGEHRIEGPEIQWAGRVMEIVDEIGKKE